ncbi:AbiEi antitoxin N-terminal domain-containing protein [Methylopila henanensis]|uniref:AbiEi antitoxin N-terminal domain-containing protein n=1 Tax=Methylopila henanensis TaxID=873516 RepID=A0ABW4K768_9HYPH
MGPFANPSDVNWDIFELARGLNVSQKAHHEGAKRRKAKTARAPLPEGLLVDSAWLSARNCYTSLRTKYVTSGWLEQPARRVYRRPRGQLSWQQVVISLKTILDHRLAVGGRTALDLQGYAHYLSQGGSKVHSRPKYPPPN